MFVRGWWDKRWSLQRGFLNVEKPVAHYWSNSGWNWSTCSDSCMFRGGTSYCTLYFGINCTCKSNFLKYLTLLVFLDTIKLNIFSTNSMEWFSDLRAFIWICVSLVVFLTPDKIYNWKGYCNIILKWPHIRQQEHFVFPTMCTSLLFWHDLSQ